jgi:hypothetical protein
MGYRREATRSLKRQAKRRTRMAWIVTKRVLYWAMVARLGIGDFGWDRRHGPSTKHRSHELSGIVHVLGPQLHLEGDGAPVVWAMITACGEENDINSVEGFDGEEGSVG